MKSSLYILLTFLASAVFAQRGKLMIINQDGDTLAGVRVYDGNNLSNYLVSPKGWLDISKAGYSSSLILKRYGYEYESFEYSTEEKNNFMTQLFIRW